jgi:hypothetical protein
MKHAFLSLFLAAMPALAHAAARVSSDSTCPSADAISQRLLGLLAAGGPEAASARVRMDGETMRIELATPGEANRERLVSVGGDCELRAEMAALVIASWLDAMPAGTIGVPNPPLPAPAAAPAPAEPHAPSKAAGPRLLAGTGLFGMADAKGTSAGFALEAAMPGLLGIFGWAAEASLSMPREMTVGQGIASYWRPTLALVATAELPMGGWRMRPRAGAALGILAVQGTNYETNKSATTVTWGGGAGIALARPWQRRELWIRLDAWAWPQGRAVRSQQVPSGPEIVVALPEWEARLLAGISWGIR